MHTQPVSALGWLSHGGFTFPGPSLEVIIIRRLSPLSDQAPILQGEVGTEEYGLAWASEDLESRPDFPRTHMTLEGPSLCVPQLTHL